MHKKNAKKKIIPKSKKEKKKNLKKNLKKNPKESKNPKNPKIVKNGQQFRQFGKISINLKNHFFQKKIDNPENIIFFFLPKKILSS